MKNKLLKNSIKMHMYKNYINYEIKSKLIRLIGVNGEQLGIFPLEEAINKAKTLNLDLVELNSNIKPSICKIMNYGKFIYEKNKSIKKNKKKQKITQIKEIKIRPNIDTKDLSIKLKNINKFLQNGNKVKIILKFKGREIIHKNIGLDILNKIKGNLNNISNLEPISSKIEGKQIVTLILPKNFN